MRKTCKNCSQNFEITDQEKIFHEKWDLPMSDTCPQDRLIEIMAFRNENRLYPRKCSLSNESILSAYQPNTSFPVYKNEIWWGDGWDGLEYGREFNLDKSFFQQFQELQKVVPREGTSIFNCENCDFNSHTRTSKNCYLNSLVADCEDVYYSHWVVKNKNVIDCIYFNDSQLCYECIDCYNLYNCFVLQESTNCSDSFFCYQIKNCNKCIFCTNITNKSFHIFNKSASEDEYNILKSKILSGSYKTWMDFYKKFLDMTKKTKHRSIHGLNYENSTGDHIYNSKNCHTCFDIHGSEDCFNNASIGDSKDVYDSYSIGWPKCEIVYKSCVIRGSTDIAFCNYVWFSNNLKYCDSCISCKNCFGCVGLKHKEYCILNKQYSKEEYEKLVPKIIEAMKSPKSPLTRGLGHPLDKGGLGDCEWNNFPAKYLSVFTYNETAAQDYFPLTKEEAITKGFKWSDFEPEFPKVEKIISANLLPDSISKIPDDILNWAVECEITKKPFKIIKPELEFYRKMNLPIPHLHPDQRHKDRMALRNPRKLWKRNCMKCNSEIQTTYSPERPEIVYCEKCYLKEVY